MEREKEPGAWESPSQMPWVIWFSIGVFIGFITGAVLS
jgi:hypothetical protein